MPLPFFCTVCDKPIVPCPKMKYQTIHDRCMVKYLDEFNGTTKGKFNKYSTTITSNKEKIK